VASAYREEAGVPMAKNRLLGSAAVVCVIIALMILFDVGIFWLFVKGVELIWGAFLWGVERLYWALSSLFEVRDGSIVP